MSSQAAVLVYFKGRGRAEQCRWLLAATETPFQHLDGGGLETAEQFKALRAAGSLAYGQVPLLQIDGLDLVQSQAIVRHVARRAGRLGGTAEEAARADMVAEACLDFRAPLLGGPFSPDGGLQAAEATWLTSAPRLEAAAAAAAAATGFAAGGEGWTHADVLLAEATTGFEELLGSARVAAEAPALAAHAQRMRALPGLVAYLGGPLRFPCPVGDEARGYVANVMRVLRG